MGFEVWGQTDVGLKRKLNEDSILIDKDLGLFIVADGMGGHEGGEVASNIAVNTCQEIINSYKILKSKISPTNLIRECYSTATRKIFQKGQVESKELMGMGTTMVMGMIVNGKFYIGNVGDSRCYLYRDNHLWQLTEDHSLVNEQIRAGIITEDEQHLVSGKNVITRSVGFEENVDVDVFHRRVEDGEIYLLCSDGLCGMVDDSVIEDILITKEPEKVVGACVEAAKQAGGDDNISVIVVRIT
ncbi:MAG: protein phosphatase [Bdellovibrionaceae bacterium]|nr:protein phosphatase [Pseudobdellovibrionaceae bacterium]|tara:strand:+ start:121020 stop:121748 length:729 start_codon:yes stop_codon:yes gene_type:complete